MNLAPGKWLEARCRRICGVLAALVALAVPAAVFVALDRSATLQGHWAEARFCAWLACLAGFFWLFFAIGSSVKRRLLGVLINERNRYSLSRLQMSLWAVLILSGLYVILLNNVYQAQPGDTFGFNWELLVLMGASVGSVVTTPMILSRKSDSGAQAAVPEAGLAGAGALDANAAATEAELVDLVLGEEVNNARIIDISRIQMLMMTLVAVTVYAWKIGTDLLAPVSGQTPFMPGMPVLDETLLGLILVSHAGYLGGKFTPSANSRNVTADQLAKAIQLSQKVTDLTRRAEQAPKDAVPGSALEKQLGNLLPLFRALAAEAGALPSLAGTDKFDAAAVARLEGKIDAASGQFAVAVGQADARDAAANAPRPEVVRAVQARLAVLVPGSGVMPSGVVDTMTMAAIDALLAQRKLTRAALSAQPYRLFEELLSLLT